MLGRTNISEEESEQVRAEQTLVQFILNFIYKQHHQIYI